MTQSRDRVQLVKNNSDEVLQRLGIMMVEKDYDEVAKAYEQFLYKKNEEEEKVRIERMDKLEVEFERTRAEQV